MSAGDDHPARILRIAYSKSCKAVISRSAPSGGERSHCVTSTQFHQRPADSRARLCLVVPGDIPRPALHHPGPGLPGRGAHPLAAAGRGRDRQRRSLGHGLRVAARLLGRLADQPLQRADRLSQPAGRGGDHRLGPADRRCRPRRLPPAALGRPDRRPGRGRRALPGDGRHADVRATVLRSAAARPVDRDRDRGRDGHAVGRDPAAGRLAHAGRLAEPGHRPVRHALHGDGGRARGPREPSWRARARRRRRRHGRKLPAAGHPRHQHRLVPDLGGRGAGADRGRDALRRGADRPHPQAVR